MTMLRSVLIAAIAYVFAVTTPVTAAEKLNLAIGQKGFWDAMVVPAGVEAGIFKKIGRAHV